MIRSDTSGVELACDLMAGDVAYPVAVVDEQTRIQIHQAWRHGQVHVVRRGDRLTLGAPGTDFTAPRVLDAVGRLAKAVGAPPGPLRRAAAGRPRRFGLGPGRGLGAVDRLGTVTREIALLTNPTAGKGRARRVRDAALPLLHGAGWRVRSLEGRDADEASDLARKAVADGVEALVVCGGDGLVHLALQVVAGTDVPLGILPAGTGNDAARSVGIPLRDPAGAVGRLLAWEPRRIDLARSGDRWFVAVLAAGFDAVVNERANKMTWPRGQMRYNLATIAELRTFEPLHYEIDLDGEQLQLEAMLVAVGQRSVVRRWAADRRGRDPGRRSARRRGHRPDEQARADPDLPEAVPRHPRRPPDVLPPPGRSGSPWRAPASSATPTASGTARCRSRSSASRSALQVLA